MDPSPRVRGSTLTAGQHFAQLRRYPARAGIEHRVGVVNPGNRFFETYRAYLLDETDTTTDLGGHHSLEEAMDRCETEHRERTD